MIPISGVYNVGISCHFFDPTTFTVYMTACMAPIGYNNLEKYFHFWKTVAIKDHRYFPIHVYTQRS